MPSVIGEAHAGTHAGIEGVSQAPRRFGGIAAGSSWTEMGQNRPPACGSDGMMYRCTLLSLAVF